MMGVDLHIPWPPGSPSPAPGPVPYRTAMLMIGSGLGVLANLTKVTEKQMTDSFSMTMLKGTDIGPLIPHIGVPSITLPVEMLFSSSKSYFSTSRYQVAGESVACSLLVVVNPNLNCGTPMPSPTGVVLALTTHRVNMTWGDVFAGLGRMFADWCVQTVFNFLGNKAGGALSKFLSARLYEGLLSKFAIEALATGGDAELALLWAGVMAAAGAERSGNIAGTVFGAALSFFGGGPMGADVGALGGYNANRDNPWTPGGAAGTSISDTYDKAAQQLGDAFEKSSTGQAVDDYLDGPGPGDYPLPPPSNTGVA